jgi:hypothetical protein
MTIDFVFSQVNFIAMMSKCSFVFEYLGAVRKVASERFDGFLILKRFGGKILFELMEKYE